MSKAKTAAGRVDCVFIRKSTQAQDEQGQIDNVRAMLKAAGVYVPEEYWFVCTVPRAKVQGNAEFGRLMELIEADRVGTVYVESQDRWGTGDVAELFTLLGVLAAHKTRLYDLRDKTDLTGGDDTTQIKAFLGGLKSKKEREDLAFRSLRTRVANFLATGSWPTGTHPYGYGKACYGPDGKPLRWVWQPVNRTRGQLYYPGEDGELHPAGPADAKIPRKAKGDVIKLVPSDNPDYVRAVGLIFDLYTRVGLSRRQISARLNSEGLTFNGGKFTHPDVTNILENPAYVGDTHFGKVQSGGFQTFDAKGLITAVTQKSEPRRRCASECLVKQGTHKPLVDRPTWELAQQKLAGERQRACYAPRNPAYYLKQVFVCGHCGKGMTGRTEMDPRTRRRTVVYLCPTYVRGRCDGHPSPCGYQRITHDAAEQLLYDKLTELGREDAVDTSVGARANLEAVLARLGHEDDEAVDTVRRWVQEGVAALLDHLRRTRDFDEQTLERLRVRADHLFTWGSVPKAHFAGLPLALAEFKAAVREAEREAAASARTRLAELRAEHAAATRSWVKATERMQEVLRQDIERLEREIRQWEERAEPLSERLKRLDAARRARNAEYWRLLEEWRSLEGREKGEALRRLFDRVTLFWDKTFHPAEAKPSRPRKTARPGRFSYTLRRDKIQWAFAACDLVSSW
jgi:hypothetical protein